MSFHPTTIEDFERGLKKLREQLVGSNNSVQRCRENLAESETKHATLVTAIADYEQLLAHMRFANGDSTEQDFEAKYAAGMTTSLDGELDELYADAYLDALDDARHADAATEAYVDVADAEHYALRDEFVNAAASPAEVEHVDYAEAEDVREIREEMALEAAGVESWEEL